jgi:ferredoxin-like protein FixX
LTGLTAFSTHSIETIQSRTLPRLDSSKQWAAVCVRNRQPSLPLDSRYERSGDLLVNGHALADTSSARPVGSFSIRVNQPVSAADPKEYLDNAWMVAYVMSWDRHLEDSEMQNVNSALTEYIYDTSHTEPHKRTDFVFSCQECPVDNYCVDQQYIQCPADTYSPVGSTSVSDCKSCEEQLRAGNVLVRNRTVDVLDALLWSNRTRRCSVCPAGSYCPNQQTSIRCVVAFNIRVASAVLPMPYSQVMLSR